MSEDVDAHHEPVEPEIEALVTDEERQALDDPNVPEDVKAEIMERLERFHEFDLEQMRPDDAGAEP